MPLETKKRSGTLSKDWRSDVRLFISASLLVFSCAACCKNVEVCSIAEQSLQQKLVHAQKERSRWEQEVQRLSVEMQQMQVAKIAQKVDALEAELAVASSSDMDEDAFADLFRDERESLCQIMDAGTSARTDAQQVLDRILRIITELSEQALR